MGHLIHPMDVPTDEEENQDSLVAIVADLEPVGLAHHFHHIIPIWTVKNYLRSR